jgi:hypothetical protein
MNEALWLWLDRAGLILGLLLAVPVFWTWWQVVFGENRRRRKWLAEIVRTPGARPGVLVVDLLPGRDIGASVKKHLAADAALANIGPERFLAVTREAALRPEQVQDLARDVRAAARRLQDTGVDVLHLFHAGPDVSALMLGAELSNGPRVLLYHYEQGEYRCFGPLEPLR